MSPFGADVRALLAVLFRAQPRLAVTWWSLIAATALLPVLLTLTIGWVVYSLGSGSPPIVPLVCLGATFVGLNVIAALAEVVSSSLGARASEWCHRQLLEACLQPDSILHLERPDLANDLAAARDFDLGISGAPLVVALPRIAARFAAIGSGVLHAALLFHLSWFAPVVLVAAWLSTNVALGTASRWNTRLSDAVMLTQRRVRYHYQLMVDSPAAKEVRLFGLGGWLAESFRGMRFALFDQSWRERKLQWPKLWKSLLAVTVANVGVLGLVLWTGSSQPIAPGLFVIYMLALAGAATLGFQDDYFLRTAAQPMPRVLQMIATMARVGTLASGTRDAADVPRRSVQLDNVTFRYSNTDAPVLKNLSLTIPAGKSIAIVGHNGAGKTTLLKLLARLYDPAEGRITVDGCDLREFALESWRSRLAIAYQDFIKYHWTLRENVAPGNASDELVVQALEHAGADGLAALDAIMVRGYENGVELSGGQWQRIALARVIARVRSGAGLVILDEPTAHLDIRAEEAIFNRLLEQTRGLTTILISHRFATVRKVDRICVLKDGQVSEEGTHDELMQLGGLYRRMFDIQAARFEETAGACAS